MMSLTKNLSRFKHFTRSISTINIPDLNINENVYERNDYPLSKCNCNLKNKQIGIIGYGPQGKGQSLNLRDNNFNVHIGVRNGKSYELALNDGWIPNENLFSIPEAVEKSDIVSYLLSDAGQIKQWDEVKTYLTTGKSLCFSHGFGIVYNQMTNIVPPEDIDVFMVAPKGAGMTVRKLFTEGRGINSSYAIHQDYTGEAQKNCLSYAFGIGSGYVFETTFEKEVFSDLLGERCVLMGLIQGAFLAQYNVLREHGHSPSEAYNETVEEALVSLYPLISNRGMDWMYENCSTTAQRGALDWAPKFEKCIKHLIQECYEEVKNGNEAKRVIDSNSDPNYRINLNQELKEMKDQELWRVAKIIRNFRASNLRRRIN
jgi:ketol-acid reductoisomerase